MTAIVHRTSAIYKDLCTREASIARAQFELLEVRPFILQEVIYRDQARALKGASQNQGTNYGYNTETQDPTGPRTTNMSKLPGLKSRLCSKIHTTRVLLTEITTPVQSPSQEIAHKDYIGRLNELTLDANTYLLDIEADYGNDIDTTGLDDFKASLYNIERKTSAVYNDLCTWKASNTRPPARVNSLDQESDQDGDTERINEGKESTDTDVPWESHGCYDTLEEETITHAKPLPLTRPPSEPPPVAREAPDLIVKTIQHETPADKARTTPDKSNCLKSVLRLRSKILLPRSHHLKRMYNKEDSKSICLMPIPRLRSRAPLPRSHHLNKAYRLYKIYSMYNKEDSTVRAQHYTIGKPSIRLRNSDTALPIPRPTQNMDQESDQYGVNKEGETVSHAEFNALGVRDHENTYRWSPEEKRRFLATKAECKEHIKTGRRIEQQGP